MNKTTVASSGDPLKKGDGFINPFEDSANLLSVRGGLHHGPVTGDVSGCETDKSSDAAKYFDIDPPRLIPMRITLGALYDIHRELLQRFAGWFENFTGERAGPNLASMLPAPPGELLQLSDPEQVLSTAQLLAVAQAWERSDCFIWAARSSRLHRDWDPLVESFAAFEASDPTCASYTLGLDPIEPKSGVQQILGFIVMQGLEQATPTSDPQAAAAAT